MGLIIGLTIYLEFLCVVWWIGYIATTLFLSKTYQFTQLRKYEKPLYMEPLTWIHMSPGMCRLLGNKRP